MLTTLKTKIEERCEDLERMGRTAEMNGLEYALKLINGMTIGDQSAKADAGKPDLTLVPQRIIWDIAQVREYGNRKYGDPENWRTVDRKRYDAALYRHFLAYLNAPYGQDEESGIEHYKHMACNMAFICEMMGDEEHVASYPG